ncbi:MAG: precorrin-6y C5,15-methyltransferase (decarboxylating) subunit CbiE [Bacteroidales bacterium]|nr:precorrin-6y C5,15-methyltransferase (decarboxylating) subunit CbiE [Bacteroidales bacterium]
MCDFTVIGIDDNGGSVGMHLSRTGNLLAGHSVFSGGKRHYGLVKEYLPPCHRWIDITIPLDDVFRQYEEAASPIVVFASGDPLFFGFATTIRKRMPHASIKVYPVFNSLQTLAHRLVMRYDDMTTVSLTGRPWKEFDRALIERKGKIGLLTDRVHTPAAIAARALHYGYYNYRMHIGEALGGENEDVATISLQEAAQGEYAFPNCVILERMDGRGCYREEHNRIMGIPHSSFSLLDGRVNMITKMPIRLFSLAMLGLYEKRTLWDIGFCTGSVSIEAKMQFPHLNVEAFEIREQCSTIMEENCRRMGVPGIEWHICDFTSLDLERKISRGELHTPDAVFIGGHGGKLCRIMKMLSKVMGPGGTVVFNSVKDPGEFEQAAVAYGFSEAEKSTITVDDYNSITCCKVTKQL